MQTTPDKQAFLLLCNKTSSSVIEAYRNIYEATQYMGESFVLYHQKEKEIPEELKKLNHFTFTDSIITRYNYIPLGFNLIPGNNHFPLFEFAVSRDPYD